jgi:hypothetical protein
MSEPGCPLWRATFECVLSMTCAAQTAAAAAAEEDRMIIDTTRKAPEISNKNFATPNQHLGQAGQEPWATVLKR